MRIQNDMDIREQVDPSVAPHLEQLATIGASVLIETSILINLHGL